MSTYLMSTYKRQPVAFTHGDGVWLFDEQGRRYLDAVSGIAVCGLGHAHPAITQCISQQASQLMHVSNLYRIPEQEKLGEKLCQLSGMDKAFFANSGAEANEAAIKIARLIGHQRGVDEPAIIVMENSFHGRTMATLSATGNRKVQAGFEPLVRGFVRAPYADIDAIEQIASQRKDIVAIMVEPVQGEGGVRIPDTHYLNHLKEICNRENWLLILDEIQTGMGRCGRWFAHQRNGIKPDILTTAKALGNGFPIGACLAQGSAAEVFGPGSHGTTFGGNPLSCKTASTVIETIESHGLVEKASAQGQKLLKALKNGLQELRGIKEIRGLGLMIGIETNRPCAELVDRARESGLLINVTADSVIRLLPPLIIEDDHIDFIATTLSKILKTFENEG